MVKVVIFIFLIFNINFFANAEFEIDYSKVFSNPTDSLKITKQGILLGEAGNNLNGNPYNGIYIDKSGDLSFTSQALPSLKIMDLDEDKDFYYASSFSVVNGQQGLFKISKDFKKIENIGLKATTRKILPYKDKVYTGGTVHGCYVVNKDGTNLTQIIGDGYFGPHIDDIKGNSKNVYILSRGLLYKVDYDTNTKEQLYISQRPSYIEVDEDRIYLTAYNKFFYLNFDNQLSNEKIFQNRITYLKKYKNLIVVAESDSFNTYFWFSNNLGLDFYKSSTTIPAGNYIKDIEITGDKVYTLYISLYGVGVLKAKLDLDFTNPKIFTPPFKMSVEEDLVDKITSFFDHEYPVLGNSEESIENSSTTLNFEGKKLAIPYMYYSSHDGIDWGLPINTNLYAVSDGVASYFYQPNGLGHAIQINHYNGYITIYGHLSEEELVTKNKDVPVNQGQKIGKVGISGNTTGPHLHFTSYKGEKKLFNKIDPFGWNSDKPDPWAEIGQKSSYLWSIKQKIYSTQFNPDDKNLITKDRLNIQIKNMSFLSDPVSLEFKSTSPIFDYKNYLYLKNTSYQIEALDFESKRLTQVVLGNLSYSGFKIGDDKFYSIWRITENNVDKMETTFNIENNMLSTFFEPNAQYLILKDNFTKIKVKSKATVN